MSKTLYIIGNGFDIFHGLPTSYRCFLCFMLREHLDDAKRLGFIFDRKNPNKLWSDFENELEAFDSLELVRKSIDKWRHIKSLCEFENLFDNVHGKLKSFFHEWILHIQMGLDNGKRITLDREAQFLNFNYTNTLEEFYHISPSKICHIHMDTLLEDSHAPIVGHSHTKNCVELDKIKVRKFIRDYGQHPQWAKNTEDFTEVVLKELNGLWDGLAKEPKDQIVDNKIHTIRDNQSFFDNCCKLEDIYVLGCSLGVADKDYYKEIYDLSPNAKWHISIYDEKEMAVKEKLASLLNREVDNLQIEFFRMNEL